MACANAATTACRLCGEETSPAGRKFGPLSGRWFELRHCPHCRFSFVENPWEDYGAIYDAAYYRGEGADPLVDYYFELEHPELTIRRYEWEGIVHTLRELTSLEASTRWLDFGCGNGGLVRHARSVGLCETVGFEEGAIVEDAVTRGIPILDRDALAGAGQFDIVTAIEVLEHVVDPVAALRQIRSLLKPGGLFFFTTGNAQPFRGRLAEWGYVNPEVHVSFFEPDTLARALRETGFRAEFHRPAAGFRDIIRFKVLKQLRVRRAGGVERLAPWSLVAPILQRRLGIGRHPIAWAA